MDSEYTARFLEATRDAAAGAAANDPQAILHSAFAAVIKGDFDGLGELMTDDVELRILGFGHIDGVWRGRKEVVAATRKNFAELGVQQPVIESSVRQGDCIAVALRETGVFKSTGATYSIRGAQWFTFENGKIKKIDEICANVA
jgi:ketosteroid isomerase-like protein